MKKKQPLLTKYGIPIENVSFDFIQDCSDFKTVEKIVKILRSGEEGYYPQLLTAAEEKLRELNPNARSLRILEPVFKTAHLSSNAAQVLQELKEWSSKISAADKELTSLKRSRMPSYPEVRNVSSNSNVNPSSEDLKMNKTIKTTDYSSWDKYDPDAELLKLEIEEERKKAEQKRQKEKKDREENERRALELSKISSESMHLTSAERDKIAEDKRVQGNEYFKLKEYQLAIKHYSESIAISETAAAFCNRALCYTKLNENFKAVNDCTACLRLEPLNVKALFRRAQALQNLKQHHEALMDVKNLLEIEPKNSAAVTLKNALLNQIGSNQLIARRNFFKRRIMVEDDDGYSDGCVKIIEVTDNELRKYSKYEFVELNEKNQLKEMCLCSLDSNYHRRSEDLFNSNSSLITSPFYRIHRVKHCYPVKVEHNRPTTSAVINSNYLHAGINVSFRTPVRNIFVVPEMENPFPNGTCLNRKITPSSAPMPNLNKMFNLRRQQNINEAITANVSHVGRQVPISKGESCKVTEVNGSSSAMDRRIDNLSTKLDILEIESEADNCEKNNFNYNVIDKRSQSSVNNYQKKSNDIDFAKSNVLNINSLNSSNKSEMEERKVFSNDTLNENLKLKNCSSDSNSTTTTTTTTKKSSPSITKISPEKSKFTVKHNSLGCNISDSDFDSNILNNNSPLSESNHHCRGDSKEQIPPKKHGITANGQQLSNGSSVGSSALNTLVNGSENTGENDLKEGINERYEPKSTCDQNIKGNVFKMSNGLGHNSVDSKVNGKTKLTPFQFLSRWQSVEESEGLSEYETLLRQTNPSSLSSVISNQLDHQMLSTMLSVFRSRFNLKEENNLVVNYLESIASLQRFGIALCCLAPEDVEVAQELFNELELQGSQDLQELKQVYLF